MPDNLSHEAVRVTHNALKALHGFVLSYSWKFLCLSVNDRRKIPIKAITKTFCSGKPEKMVQKCLSDLGLAGDKVRFLFLVAVMKNEYDDCFDCMKEVLGLSCPFSFVSAIALVTRVMRAEVTELQKCE